MSEKIKNILINYTGRTGAGINYAYEMCKGFLNNGINVYVVISRQADNFVDWCELPVTKLIPIDTYTNKREFLIHTIRFILWERNIITKELNGIKIDAIYVPMATYWTGMISSLFPNSPVYYTLHDTSLHSGEILFNKIWYKLSKKEISKAKKIIVLSKLFVDDVKRKYNKNDSDIMVIPHAAFWEYKNKYHSGNNETLMYSSKKINFLFFGRIEKYKGLDILFKAYNALRSEMGDRITLTIAGKGDVGEYIAGNSYDGIRIINKMIPDELIGGLFDGPNIVTVLPYIDATQSGVIPTAMMFNSLVIVSDVGALPEQVGYGEYGVVVEANNIEKLKNSMKNIVVNYKEYDTMKEKAIQHVDLLTWDNLARDVFEESEEISR